MMAISSNMDSRFWDAKARDYDRLVERFFPEIYRAIGENIVQDTAGSQRLLDAATATGSLAIHLSGHIPHITAIDISPRMIGVAREKAGRMQINNIVFSVGDIYHLKFEDKSFDTVLASNVLHLLAKPELALQEMKRVLNDSGRIIVPVFCHAANLRSKFLTLILSLLGQKPRNRWTRKSFMDYIVCNGFKITKTVCMNGKIPLVYLVAVKNNV